MKERHEIINVVYLYPESCFGVVDNLGAYASVIKYTKNEIEYEELIDNEDFVIVEEIVLTHIEEN